MAHYKSDTNIQDRSRPDPTEWVTVTPHDIEPAVVPPDLQIRTQSPISVQPNSVRNSLRNSGVTDQLGLRTLSVNNARHSVASRQRDITAQSSALSTDQATFVTAEESSAFQGLAESISPFYSANDMLPIGSAESQNEQETNREGNSTQPRHLSSGGTFKTATEHK